LGTKVEEPFVVKRVDAKSMPESENMFLGPELVWLVSYGWTK
jgi:hypothetical protein